MAYARTFVKVRILGTFGTPAPGVEQWSTGFNVSSVGGGSFDPANLLTFLTAIDPLIATYMISSGVNAGTNTYYTGLTAAYLGTDGKYVLGGLQPTTVFTRATPTQGQGTPVQPFSAAQVITLRSLVLRGPASHGRLYWPAVGVSIPGATGLIPTATVNNAANAAKIMFNAINAAAATRFGTGSNVSLVSQVGAGREAVVTQVGIGSRLDHMESRERNLLEAHQFWPLTVSTALLEARDKELRDGFEDAQSSEAPVV